MLYPINTIIAIDQATGARVENGSGYVYALSDTARATPLNIFDLSGLPLTSNLLETNSEALIPPFQVEGEWQVVFVSGDSEIILTSYLGLKEEAAASADAANTVVTRADNGEFKGAQGDSAYQVWLSLGNVGTVEDYRADIEGAPGKDGSNVLPTDEAITQAINDTASSTRGALNATYLDRAEAADTYATGESVERKAPSTLPEAGSILAKLHRGQSDAVLLVMGDSTGQGDFDLNRRWPLLFSEQLAAKFPAYTVRFHMWNGDYLGGLHAYDAPVTIQTGTGIHFLDVYNGSASGTTASYTTEHFAAIAPATPDAVIVNHGHNHPLLNFMVSYGELVRKTRAAFPVVPIILTAQNPRLKTSAGYADQLKIREIIALYAAREGYGFIDITTVFENDADYQANLMSDEIHPNDAGYQAWADEVTLLFDPAPGAQITAHRPNLDSLWYPSGVFTPSAGAPEISMALYGLPLSGWALDPATAESVNTIVNIPEDWRSLDYHIFWTTHADPGGLGPGAVMWNTYTFSAIQRDYQPAATFPVPRDQITNTIVGQSRGTETVAESGEVLMLRRISHVTGTTNEYLGRGLHGLRVQRFANNSGDTLPIDAVFIGVLFERTE